MVERREFLIQLLKMIRQRALRIDEERGAEFFGEGFDGDTFTKQFITDVTKIVHKDLF
jgi:hypothetical protein